MFALLTLLDNPEDSDGFQELYWRYKKLAHWVAGRILNDSHLAEDAVQEAFTRIAKHYSKISGENPVDSNRTKNFVVVVTERAAIDIYRKRKKMLEQEVFTESMEETAYALDNNERLEDSRVYEAIHSLPKNYSEVLLLHYVNGFSCSEIADFLGMNENTVRTNLTRGKRQLEMMLSDLLVSEQPEKEGEN